jgi:uncharacterized protein
MKSRHPVRSIGVALVASTSLALLTACGGQSTPTASSPPSAAASVNSGTFTSPSQNLGNGTVKTYVTTDQGGIPVEVGLRLSESALDGLPANTPPTDMLMLDLPDQAAATAFDHVMMNWNPQGHDPVVLFGKPHFDFHFDMADMATLQSIDPSDPDFATKADHLPDAKYVPQNYVVPPGGSAAAQAVPGMGVHLVDSSDTSLVPGSYDFQQIIINGTWDGRYTFVEPMVTRDWLLTKPTLEQQPLKQPQAYQKKAYYPTTYSVRFDEQAKEYVIAVGGMTMREPS